MIIRVVACLIPMLAAPVAANAQDAFRSFLQGVRADALRAGVSARVFDAETAGLSPDMTLPDLERPGRPGSGKSAQAEFTLTPAAYLAEKSFSGMTSRGRALARQHAATLSAIERRTGVPGSVIISIWGRESGFGAAKIPHDALRVVATQAFTGRRKAQYRGELIALLRLLEAGHPREAMRSSWAGAMGHMQMLPSQALRYGTDLDGDGRADIWRSIPDALATAAAMMQGQGWQAGRRWAYEVKLPANVDCTLGDPDRPRPVGEWIGLGFAPADGRMPSAAENREPAVLLMPAGPYGPGFLATRNYFVLKDYNFSDLYVLFVGHLADRIAGRPPFATPWGNVRQLSASGIETIQRELARRGLYSDVVDGKAGMKTRLAIGRYQKAAGLKADCWPSRTVVDALRAQRG